MSSGETRDAMRSYVTGESGAGRTEDLVKLNVSHSNLKANFVELRFDLHMSIEDVIGKACYHAGNAAAGSAIVHLFDSIGNQVATLDDMTKMLGFYGPEDGWGLHIQDLDPNSLHATGWLEDVSLVKKYEISDEDYEKRQGNARAWIRSKKAADPNWTIQTEMRRRKDPNYQPPPKKPDDFEAEEAAMLSVGSRCEVHPGGRRGEIKYVGKAEGCGPGYWVGVLLDDPVSMSKSSDGTSKGKKYFDAPEKYGTWSRPTLVVPGDFPNELDELDELDEI